MIDTIKIREDLFKLISSGKVKTKGAYEVLPYNKLGWHKNHSSMVVPQAVLSDLLGFCNFDDYITNHQDPYDFFLRTKVPRNSRLVLVDQFEVDNPLQNICRYYPSHEGGKLVKIMPPLKPGLDERRLGIDTEWFVKPCNDFKEFNWDVNYDYYIQTANKLLEAVRINTEEQ